jgi:hypothetical protein
MRIRVWHVKPPEDPDYRKWLQRWYDADYSSDNFQAHPPLNEDSNKATKEIGDIELPLAFEMTIEDGEMNVDKTEYNPGKTKLVQDSLSDWQG